MNKLFSFSKGGENGWVWFFGNHRIRKKVGNILLKIHLIQWLISLQLSDEILTHYIKINRPTGKAKKIMMFTSASSSGPWTDCRSSSRCSPGCWWPSPTVRPGRWRGSWGEHQGSQSHSGSSLSPPESRGRELRDCRYHGLGGAGLQNFRFCSPPSSFF